MYLHVEGTQIEGSRMEFILIICLAAFALGLGFVALLKQKAYLDANSGTVTAVESHLLTNYKQLERNHLSIWDVVGEDFTPCQIMILRK
jgi:hypothetical protein